MSDKYAFFRAYVSSYLHGKTNAEAMLQTLADDSVKLQDLSIAVTNQLTISTASDIYLDKRMSEIGITRPPETGMDDLAFRQMGIQLNSSKQLIESIHTILATFYGDETVRASTTCGQPEPYFLEDGDTLQFKLEGDEIFTLTVKTENFDSIQQATSKEIADLLTAYIRARGLNGYAKDITDIDTGLKYVRIFGGAKGPYGLVQILGGQMQSEMEFPTIRATQLPVNDTVWEITRTVGSTHRFRWVSGSRPLLEKVLVEDRILLYGQQFLTLGIYGTYDVTNLRPAQGAPATDAGWFEFSIEGYSALKSSQPDINPPPNAPGAVYSITVTQANFSDLKFYLAQKFTSYGKSRYALGWEPKANLLKVYMPASTQVIKRDLVGSAHLHLLYRSTDFNGSYGSTSVNASKVILTSARSIQFKQPAYDNLAYGGIMTVGLSNLPIDYIVRENGITSVFLTQEHGLTGTMIQGNNLYSGVVGITVVAPEDDQNNAFPGPYILDPEAAYTLTDQRVTSKEQILAGDNRNAVFVKGLLAYKTGELLFDLNQANQEGPVRFLDIQQSSSIVPVPIASISQNGTTVTVITATPHGAGPGSQVAISSTVAFNGNHTAVTVPSPNVYTFSVIVPAIIVEFTGLSTVVLTDVASTLILDPSYSFKYTHDIGSDITVISDNKAYTPTPNGIDYGMYVTGIADGRLFAEQLMQEVTALGINLEIVIMFPSGVGLGYGDKPADDTVSPHSEVTFVWGI
jgi:hypothetical protein